MLSIDTLWPDLSFYDFFCLVRKYQDNYPTYVERAQTMTATMGGSNAQRTGLNERSKSFVEKLKQRRKERIHELTQTQ